MFLFTENKCFLTYVNAHQEIDGVVTHILPRLRVENSSLNFL